MKEAKEITPVRAVLIYSMTLILVVFFELPKVLSWVEETRWKLASGQVLDSFSVSLIGVVSKASGPTELTRQAHNYSAAPLYPQRTDEDQPVVSSPPPEQGVDQLYGPPGSDGADPGESPLPQSALNVTTSEQESDGGLNGDKGRNASAEETSSPKLKPRRVLLVGDSMIAEGFGPALQRRLRKCKSLDVVRKGQYSTGFVHQEDFDWASTLKELIRKDKPDLIVIHMGTNDPIDILDGSGKRLYFGNDLWREVYASRVREFLKFTSDKKILTFWIGLPIMSSDKYCAKISIINSIFEQECAKTPGCVYVDSWNALADSSGSYANFIRGPGGKQTRIRAKDNVHLTEAGGEILSEFFLRSACKYVDFSYGDEDVHARQ